MDKRIYIIAFLAVSAAVLTFIRESETIDAEPLSLPFSSKQGISGDHIYRIADTTLRSIGVDKKNVRSVKNSNDVRVRYPEKFDVLYFIAAMKDSLNDYDAEIVSVENVKEKTSIVQIKHGDTILKSFIFSKEPQSLKKGVSSSVPKKPARQ
jgi:hypothetical protein